MGIGGPERVRGWARVGAALLTLLILAGTLTPGAVPRTGTLAADWRCGFCGERGVADAISNVLLFLPLGALLGLALASRVRAVLLAVLLSAVVEFSQGFIPGRFVSASDLLFNTVGAGVGLALVSARRWWWNPGRGATALLRLASAGAVLGAVAAAGFFNRPSLPSSSYFVQWTPDLGHLDVYGGRVVAARFGGETAAPGRSDRSRALAEAVARGAPLEVRVVVGPPPEGLAPVWSVYDERQREIVLLGVDGHDLVYRYRREADDYGLDRGDRRLRGVLRGVPTGSEVTARVRTDRREGLCMSVNGDGGCGLGFTAGSGWTLLLFSERFPPWLPPILDFGWLVVVLTPLGFYGLVSARGGRAGAGALALVGLTVLIGLGVLPARVGLEATPPLELAAGGAGLLLGGVLGALARRGGGAAPDGAGERRPDSGLQGVGQQP